MSNLALALRPFVALVFPLLVAKRSLATAGATALAVALVVAGIP
jgi:hypothetical protein